MVFIRFHLVLFGFHLKLFGFLMILYCFHIRHSASCEGVFSGIVALAGLFSVRLRAPKISFPGCLGVSRGVSGPSVFGVFFVLFSKSLF